MKELPQDMTSGCGSLTSLILPDSVEDIHAGAISESVVRLELPSGLRKYSSDFSWGSSIRAQILPDNLESIYFSAKDFLCRAGTTTEATLKRMNEDYTPSVILPGEPSAVVGALVSAYELELCGVKITAAHIEGSGYGLYVRESDLKRCGYKLDWDGENRTTIITPPSDVSISDFSEWRALDDESLYEIWSSDVRFTIDGYTVPSLNIGGGESVLEINSLIGYKAY